MSTSIQIQSDDFCLADVYSALAQGDKAGAVVTFVGRVRDFSGDKETMHIQHYPGMTERVLEKIAQTARDRWPLHDIHIVHRVGILLPGDQIVLVGVSSTHRDAAFSACNFILDILKTEAPFWKKEGTNWVEAKNSDSITANRWLRGDTDKQGR